MPPDRIVHIRFPLEEPCQRPDFRKGMLYRKAAAVWSRILTGLSTPCGFCCPNGPSDPSPSSGSLTLDRAVWQFLSWITGYVGRGSPANRVALLSIMAIFSSPIWRLYAQISYFQNRCTRRAVQRLLDGLFQRGRRRREPKRGYWVFSPGPRHSPARRLC